MAYPSKMRLISLLGSLAVVGALFVPALPKLSYAQDPAPSKIESDDASVTRDGTWHSQTANAASGGSYLYNSGEATLTLNFAGPSLEVIYVSGPSLGTLAIEVDGTVLRTVITTDSETRYGQVAKIDYLTDEPHELKVYAQGGGVVAVDAFTLATPDETALQMVANSTDADPRFGCDPANSLHRVNLANGGFTEANAVSGLSDLSGDGRYVAFQTTANNLVAGDTNGHEDVFVRDQATCETQRISVASDGTQGNGASSFSLLSSDGRYVAFHSNASNLVADDTNGMGDVFVRDRQTNTITRVSIAFNGAQSDQPAGLYSFSSDGRFVLFLTAAVLDLTDTNTTNDFYVHDRQIGSTRHVPVTVSNPRDNFTGFLSAQISDDGRFITFVASFHGASCWWVACTEVYLHDRQTNLTTRVSPGTGFYGSRNAVISSDGRYIAFDSDSANAGNGPGSSCTFIINTDFVTFPCKQIYLYDRTTTQTTRVTSVGSSHWATNPHLSADGRYLTYEVRLANTNFAMLFPRVVFLDRQTGQSATFNNNSGEVSQNAVSANGQVVAFASTVSDLVAGDTNGVVDVFVVGVGPVPPAPADALALIRPSTNTVALVSTLDETPSPLGFNTYIANPPAAANNGQWVMGDWNGDGDDTPGVYGTNGVFYYTNSIGTNTTWQSVWIGLLSRPPVAGRFNAGVNHDCIGAVDSANFPPYGTAFALYFTCDLTDGTAPPLTFQWLSVVLPDAGGFSGTHQFAAGDFNNDGVDSIAIRRGEFIAFGNVPPTTLLSEFNLAQYWGVPPVTGGDYGLFLAGDFDNAGGDSFGVHYQNGNFYYRNAVDWYPGPHSLQQVGQPIGTPVQATSWR